ncbi:tyrosine-type recombinase/integrase [Brevibacterium renqingii]|uniref:tyrosine-type recombinase/integrase n=1 Tax=Brevibacterium renqingii TaxID=2776916 RepID=UPI001AE0E5D2
MVGYTCPNCPMWDEPIRRVEAARGVRFRVVVDATPRGAAKRKQATKTLDSLSEARQFVAKVRAEVSERGGLDSRTLTVKLLVEKFVASHSNVRKTTAENYLYRAKPITDALGDIPVRDLRPSHVDEFKADALSGQIARRDGKPYAVTTVRGAIKHLAQALDYAIRDDIITRNVARVVDMPTARQVIGVDLEHWKTTGRGSAAVCADLDKFRAKADLVRLAGAWRLTLCGLTRADVMGLRWSDVDLDTGTVAIRQGRVIADKGSGDAVGETKSPQRRRTVPVEEVEPGTLDLLRKLKTRQSREKLEAGAAYSDTGYLVVDELGHPIRPELYSDHFRALCKLAKVPVIHLHSVRHTLAFLMHRLGVPPVDAAAFLGHTVEVHIGTYLKDAGSDGVGQAGSTLGARRRNAS